MGDAPFLRIETLMFLYRLPCCDLDLDLSCSAVMVVPNKVFRHQIRRDLEAYVDDMVIKITSEIEMLKDIQETFEREEKETPTNFLVEIPSEDNERKEKRKEIDPKGKEYTSALRFKFETTNNETEYETLLAAKQASIKDYLKKVKTALRGFEDYTVAHVRRNQNKKVDALSKLTLMTFEHLTKEVLVEVLTKREVLKEIQVCEKCKEESAIRKAGTSRAIAVGSTCPFNHWGIHVIGPLPMALEGRQLTQSQQGWVDNLAKTLWIHRTLPRNSEKETPFSLTYGLEAVIPIIETTDDMGRLQKATKGKESDEVNLIEKGILLKQVVKIPQCKKQSPNVHRGRFHFTQMKHE
nr:reverse transcriptase domain-containing protein [Tanacetum cinerariifolium]